VIAEKFADLYAWSSGKGDQLKLLADRVVQFPRRGKIVGIVTGD
jgi:hypothetical protein